MQWCTRLKNPCSACFRPTPCWYFSFTDTTHSSSSGEASLLSSSSGHAHFRFRQDLRAVAQAGAPIVLTALQMIRDRERRRAGFYLLHHMKPDAQDAVPILENAIHDKNPVVNYAAARILGKIARPIPRSVLDLLSHEDPRLRSHAVIAVCESGLYSFDSLPILRSLLEDPDPMVRNTTANEAFALRKPALTTRLLVERLDHEEDRIRTTILWRLGYMDVRPYMQRLLPLANDHEPLVHEAALHAIGRGGRYGESERAIMRAALKDEHPHVKRSAMHVLLDYPRPPSPSILPILLSNMQPGNYYLLRQSTQLIVRIGSPAAIPKLRLLTRHYDESVRDMAQYALRKLEPKADRANQ